MKNARAGLPAAKAREEFLSIMRKVDKVSQYLGVRSFASVWSLNLALLRRRLAASYL
jgi:hypothetical protein